MQPSSKDILRYEVNKNPPFPPLNKVAFLFEPLLEITLNQTSRLNNK